MCYNVTYNIFKGSDGIMLDKKLRVLIVGLGLIGGSYARRLTSMGYTVTAIDTDSESVDYALREGIVVAADTEVNPTLVRETDIIVFALYPQKFIEWIKEYQHLISQGCIITDVTGVKSCVVGEIQGILRPDVEFIAAHPMAGREVSGVQNSRADLFEGANYIVVPTERNTPAAIEVCRQLGETLGFANISVLSPEEHDDIIGFVSQLTHCIAVSLMTCSDCAHLVDYTGDSFRDLTRIARINDKMWSELFLLNRPALLRQMEVFMDEFKNMYDLLESGDREGLREKMRLSTERRMWFDKK